MFFPGKYRKCHITNITWQQMTYAGRCIPFRCWSHRVVIRNWWSHDFKLFEFRFCSIFDYLNWTEIKSVNWVWKWSKIEIRKIWSNGFIYFGESGWTIIETFDSKRATSMLVTDVGDEMCLWQLWDVGDGFGCFCRQHPLSLNISVGHQQPKDVTNIEILSPTSVCHQLFHLALENMLVEKMIVMCWNLSWSNERMRVKNKLVM